MSFHAGQAVGVIGAGTMGAGIAQVAASAGHPVRLFDLRPGAAAAACERIGASLAAQVDKGRIGAGEREAVLARIVPVDNVTAMREVVLGIEVIAEDLQAKRTLLQELERQLGPEAILASNTSSISITALANGLQRPERLVGMHFFNPVPLMKLVEVVSGADTAPEVAAAVFDTAARWGKTPVHAKSTPGFIVNRIARPYYAEALALLQEQAAAPDQIDALARAAGFRMGPCELMDLIGHDVNYAVTQSVFEANYGDRRYVPSLVQKALVDGGHLGRKAGRGFYQGESPRPAAALPPASPAVPVVLLGQDVRARRLAASLDKARVAYLSEESAPEPGLRIGSVTVLLTDGRSAAQRAAQSGQPQLAVMDLPGAAGGALGIAFSPRVAAPDRETVRACLAAWGFVPVELRDVPGLLVARTIAMLVNEACDAVWQGVCSAPDADLAMKLGTNYPAGPFEWLEQFGADYLVVVLDHLFEATRSERYRVSPLLQQHYWTSRIPA